MVTVRRSQFVMIPLLAAVTGIMLSCADDKGSTSSETQAATTAAGSASATPNTDDLIAAADAKAAGFTAPTNAKPAAAGACDFNGKRDSVSKAAGIKKLNFPAPYQVFQRDSAHMGRVFVAGVVTNDVTCVGVSTTHSTLTPAGRDTAWTSLQNLSFTAIDGAQKQFSGWFPQYAGVYTATVAGFRTDGKGKMTMAYLTATADHVGVGEVFIAAGQSNSTNSGYPVIWRPGLPTDPSIYRQIFSPSATDTGDAQPIYPVSDLVSGASINGELIFRLGQSPLPGPQDGNGQLLTGPVRGGGNPWSIMAKDIATRADVPVMIMSVGQGSTSVDDWQATAAAPSAIRNSSGNPVAAAANAHLVDLLIKTATWQTHVGGGFRAILWHQGENDYGDPKGTYAAKLNALIGNVRAKVSQQTGQGDQPWLIAQVYNPSGTAAEAKNQAVPKAQLSVTVGQANNKYPAVYAGPDTAVLLDETAIKTTSSSGGQRVLVGVTGHCPDYPWPGHAGKGGYTMFCRDYSPTFNAQNNKHGTNAAHLSKFGLFWHGLLWRAAIQKALPDALAIP